MNKFQLQLTWFHDYRRGKTKGSCFPDSFGGSCSGTPRECQDCNRAIRCHEDTPTPVRSQTQPRPIFREPGTRDPSSLFEVVAGGTYVTICDNWPHAQCKVEIEQENKQHLFFLLTGWASAKTWFCFSDMYQPVHRGHKLVRQPTSALLKLSKVRQWFINYPR